MTGKGKALPPKENALFKRILVKYFVLLVIKLLLGFLEFISFIYSRNATNKNCTRMDSNLLNKFLATLYMQNMQVIMIFYKF